MPKVKPSTNQQSPLYTPPSCLSLKDSTSSWWSWICISNRWLTSTRTYTSMQRHLQYSTNWRIKCWSAWLIKYGSTTNKKVLFILTSPSSHSLIRLYLFKILYICNVIWNRLWANVWKKQIVLKISHLNLEAKSYRCLAMGKNKVQMNRTRLTTCVLLVLLMISLKNWGWKFNRILRILCYLLFVEIYIS